MTDDPAREPGIYARLIAQPWRFGFDAAVRLLMRLRRQPDPDRAARFRTAAGLAYPAADIATVTDDRPGQPPALEVTLGGLSGPSGVLPRMYSELVVRQDRAGARGLHAFLDMLGHRMLAAFAEAGIKYRPARSAERALLAGKADPHQEVLRALTGQARAEPAQAVTRDPILYYAGFFSTWPRSADRLEAMLSEWMGHPVQVLQFQGAWLDIPPDQQTRLPKGRDRGRFNQLGVDAAIGTRAWDPHGRVVIRIDGLDLPAFRALLPGRADAGQLVALIRAYLGMSVEFAINPALRPDAVPRLQLPKGRAQVADAPRLGWDTWLDQPNRQSGGDEARFPARAIEAAALVTRMEART